MSTIVVTDARPEDVASARRFSVDTGMFDQEESGEVERQLLAVIRGQDAGTVLTAKDGPVVVGAGYFAPEPFSDRCWILEAATALAKDPLRFRITCPQFSPDRGVRRRPPPTQFLRSRTPQSS